MIVWADRFAYPPAVLAPHSPGLVSVFAHQHGRQLSAYGGDLPAPLAERGATARDELGRPGSRLYPPPVACTLLAHWEGAYKDPWLILTDLALQASDAGWYGLQSWIAQGFKSTKRPGWQWHRTRMCNPARATCLWLSRRCGGSVCGRVADATISVSTLLDVTGWCPEHPRMRRATRLRLVSVFRQGWVRLLVALLRQDPLPAGHLVPEHWPVVPPLAEEVCTVALTMAEAA